jgi:hypothetical protein
MVNEDSTLFWTFNPEAPKGTNLPEPQGALLALDGASRHDTADGVVSLRVRWG